MAATMSGRLFLVNETVLRRLLKASLVDVAVVEGVFLFPFCLEVVDVDATAGRGLDRVYRLPSVEPLTMCFSQMCCCDLLDHALLRMRSCSDKCPSIEVHVRSVNCELVTAQ